MQAYAHCHSSLPAGVPVPAETNPSAPKPEFGDLSSRAFHNPFLDDFEEVVAGTKYKPGELHGNISNRGVQTCLEKVFPSSEKVFPRRICSKP